MDFKKRKRRVKRSNSKRSKMKRYKQKVMKLTLKKRTKGTVLLSDIRETPDQVVMIRAMVLGYEFQS